MIILFDLDYTLFDSRKFKTDLARVLGMSEDEFNKSYEKNFKSKNINYGIDKHLGILGKGNDEALKQDAKIFFKTIDRYLLPQAEEILEKLEPGNRLIMVSYGDKPWQKIKLDNLRIKKYFNPADVICVSDDKRRALDFLENSREKIIIVDDNAREGAAMKKHLKNSELYIVKGPYSNNIDHDQEVYTLTELEKKFFPEQPEALFEEVKNMAMK